MTKVKIPKRVAGVKIPKKVRRKAKKAVRMAESPVVREFAAAALGAAAHAKAVKASRAGSNGGRTFTKGAVRIDGDKLADVVRAAALDGLRRFLEGFEEGLRNAAAVADDDGGGGERGEVDGGRPSSGSSAGDATGG